MDLEKNLRKLLDDAVRNNLAESILISGGIDSSTLTYFALRNNSNISAINVRLEGYNCQDERYSNIFVKKIGLKNFYITTIEKKEIDKLVEKVVLSLENFNPYWVSAGVVLYKGLLKAKRYRLKSVMTGEGADDLFGSFPVMLKWKYSKNELIRFINIRLKDIDLMTQKIAKSVGINILLPYYYQPLVDFVLNLPLEIRTKNRAGKKITKYLLRKAMKGLLPNEIVNRPQTMAFTGVPTLNYLEQRYDIVNQKELNEAKKNYGINFQSSFEYCNFKILNNAKKYNPKWKENCCLYCGSELRAKNSVHCPTCGTLQYKGEILPF